jgi:hypothetical protein
MAKKTAHGIKRTVNNLVESSTTASSCQHGVSKVAKVNNNLQGGPSDTCDESTDPSNGTTNNKTSVVLTKFKSIPVNIVSSMQTSTTSNPVVNPLTLERELVAEAQSKLNSIQRDAMVVTCTPRTESTISSLAVDDYPKFANDLCGTTNLDNEKRAIKRFTRETLFTKLKFINGDSELDYTGTDAVCMEL